MATITPTRSSPARNIEKVVWASQATGDTATGIQPNGIVRGSVQFTGTFGGATAVLQGSNDGTNWATLKDRTGTAISATAAGMFDIETGALQIRPSTSGGTADSITTTFIQRHQSV